MRDGRPLPAEERRLAQATRRAVEAAGGLKVCEAETRVSDSQLSRCGSIKHPDSITVRDAVRIDGIGVRERGHPHILQAMASLLGAVVIMLPDAEGGDLPCLRSGVLDLTARLGDVADQVCDVLSPESEAGTDVTSREAEAVLQQLDRLASAVARMRPPLEARAHRAEHSPAPP